MNYRKEWFNWVAKERKRLTRKNKNATHREAMAAASITWPKQKAKLMKAAREAKRAQKASTSLPVAPTEEDAGTSTS